MPSSGQAVRQRGVAFVALLLLVASSAGTSFLALPAGAPQGNTKALVAESYGQLPLVFEPNLGQTDEEVQFLNRTGSTTTYFTPTETVFVRSYHDGDTSEVAESSGDSSEVKQDTLRMSLIGANDDPVVSGLNEQASRSNYFVGNNPDEWQTEVPHYEKIQYSQVYPGIDLVYYGNNSNLEHDFVVSPPTLTQTRLPSSSKEPRISLLTATATLSSPKSTAPPSLPNPSLTKTPKTLPSTLPTS